MQLDRFLEGISLFHNLPVLHRYHAIVHVCCQLGLLGLLLILKPGIACAKRIHLVALADLEAKSAHFVLQKLVMEIAARPRVLPNLLRHAVEEVSFNSRLVGGLWLYYLDIFNNWL